MLRIGVVGIGNMGRAHAQYLAAGQIEGAALTAVCDIAPAALEWARTQLGSEIKRFASIDDLLASGSVDGVIIATPHYDHPPQPHMALRGG